MSAPGNAGELGRTVATFDAETIHTSIAQAAAAALRAGVAGRHELADLRPAEDAVASPESRQRSTRPIRRSRRRWLRSPR